MTHTWLELSYSDEPPMIKTENGLQDMTESDYNLMLAAPDLLAVLEHIAGHADMARTCANDAGRIKSLENIVSSARAAIAKARGES